VATRHDVLIIGGGIAGAKAAIEAKISEPSASVAMLSDESATYSRTAMTSVILGAVRSLNSVTVYPLGYLRSLGVKFLGGYEASSVDRNNQVVQAKTSSASSVLRVWYKRLIIATGSVPGLPSIEGSQLPGVFTVKWFDETLSLSRYLIPGMNAFVVGAGFVGLKTAEALVKRGVRVTMAVRSRILREVIEPIFSLHLKKWIEQRGVKTLTGVSPTAVGGKRRVEHVEIRDEKVPASLVVFATGMAPNIDVARKAGVTIGRTGAIKVDRRMQTSIPEIYAAGDCVETSDIVGGKSVYRPLGSLAARTGEVAGSNAAGIGKIFPGSLRRQYDDVFGVRIISTGLSSEEASQFGISAEALDVEVIDSKHDLLSTRMPLDAQMKVIREKGTDVILGWQVVGHSRVGARYSLCLDELIRNRRGVGDLQELGLRVL